jgi:hypothetical protein
MRKRAQTPPTEANKARSDKYPTVIDIEFANGERGEILEFFTGIGNDPIESKKHSYGSG